MQDRFILVDDCVTIIAAGQKMSFEGVKIENTEKWKKDILAHNQEVARYNYKPSDADIREYNDKKFN